MSDSRASGARSLTSFNTERLHVFTNLATLGIRLSGVQCYDISSLELELSGLFSANALVMALGSSLSLNTLGVCLDSQIGIGLWNARELPIAHWGPKL